jgi:hypothetical protein
MIRAKFNQSFVFIHLCMAVSLLVRIDHETYVAAISLGEEMLGE